jgi:hypothetical protein
VLCEHTLESSSSADLERGRIKFKSPVTSSLPFFSASQEFNRLSFKICVISGVHQKASGRVACRKSLALLIVTLVSESASIERELWTATDFLDWLQPGVHADLIDGEEFMHSPGSLKNARLTNFLDHLLRSWLERTTFGGELHREMVAVRLDSRNVFLPDLCWFDAEQKARLPETHAPFAPRWVCEVLSPRTTDRDTGPNFPLTKRPACANIGCSIPKPSRTGFTFDRSKANISKNSPAEKIGSLRAFSKDSAFPVSGFVRKPCKMFRLAWTQFHRDRHNAY